MHVKPVFHAIELNRQKPMRTMVLFRLRQSIAVFAKFPDINIPPDFDPFILNDCPAPPDIPHSSVSMVDGGKLADQVRLFHVKSPLGNYQIGTSAKIPMGGFAFYSH